MNKRLKAFLTFRGSTLAQLERDIGIGAGTLSKAVKNNKTIGADKVMKILQFYTDLSAEWLMRGEGDMIREGLNYKDSKDLKIESLEAQVASLTREKENYWQLIQKLTEK